MNWHGKPLGAKSDEVLASLREIITNNGPVGLSAEEPTEECPTVSMSVKLSEPPSYKEGEKVAIFNNCVLFPIIFMLLSYIYMLLTSTVLIHLHSIVEQFYNNFSVSTTFLPSKLT